MDETVAVTLQALCHKSPGRRAPQGAVAALAGGTGAARKQTR